jgi:hypothetical protein
MTPDQLSLLQRRIATIAIGPSTARGMGPKGTIAAAHRNLQSIDLNELSKTSASDFPVILDALTDALKKALPNGAQHWGSARKFLNLFLADVLYSRHLCEAWPLLHLEECLEVPLDSHVAFALREEPEGRALPRWKTVIGLTPEMSAQFQEAASAVAGRHQCARVHLDLMYWRRAGTLPL